MDNGDCRLRLCVTSTGSRSARAIVDVRALCEREALPVRRFVGDMSRTDQLLRGLDLPRTSASQEHPP